MALAAAAEVAVQALDIISLRRLGLVVRLVRLVAQTLVLAGQVGLVALVAHLEQVAHQDQMETQAQMATAQMDRLAVAAVAAVRLVQQSEA